jgi:hypothetical protein
MGYRAHVPLLESFVQFDESIRSLECLLMRIQVLDFAHNYCSVRITNIGEVPNQMQTKITGRISYSF